MVMTQSIAVIVMTYKCDKKEFIQLRLSPAFKERIRSAATKEGVTMTWYVEDAIEQKLRQTRKTGRTDGR